MICNLISSPKLALICRIFCEMLPAFSQTHSEVLSLAPVTRHLWLFPFFLFFLFFFFFDNDLVASLPLSNLGIAHSSSHFQVELKGCELFQRFRTSLAPRPKPAEIYELSHGTSIQPAPFPPRICPAELMAFTARGKPEIRQIGRALDRRPAGVRHNSLGLGS